MQDRLGWLRFRWCLEGAGAAVLALMIYAVPLLLPHHVNIFHDPQSVSTVASGFVITLTIACILFMAFLWAIEKLYPDENNLIWAALLAILVLKSADFAAHAVQILWGGRIKVPGTWTLPLRVTLLVVALSATLLLWRFYPAMLRKSVRAGRAGLAVLGCGLLWIYPQLVYTAIRAHAATMEFNRSVQTASAPQERIIWILLDELSYDQVFEHRQPDVKLPHFDELRRQSVVFSDVQPVGYYTEEILPTLLLGRWVDAIRSSLRRDLYVHYTKTSRWGLFDQQASVFGEAKEAGWTTGLAGWYNPYCHILKNVLDSCYWQFSYPFFDHHLSEEKTAELNAVALSTDLVRPDRYDPVSHAERIVEGHLTDYNDLIGASDALIRNESIRFVFFHLPVPHPPGIYDRKTNTMRLGGTYLDNLALADRTLGDLLDAIQKTEAGPHTTVIVSSDHSWRVPLWRADSSWTAEEERASRGKFDTRPVLVVHFPGSTVGETRREPFSELGTTGILRAMLQHEIQSQADLDRWLAKHETPSSRQVSLDQR